MDGMELTEGSELGADERIEGTELGELVYILCGFGYVKPISLLSLLPIQFAISPISLPRSR